MKHYAKKELVTEILDERLVTHKYIFSHLGIASDRRISGSVKGNGAAFIKAHSTTDRRSDYIYVNADRILAFKNTWAPVPADIVSLMSDRTEEDVEGIELIEESINNYFSEN